jgi:diguanylate cyclase (GGDEF)-like protein/PAS domain S-box-containing protein
VFEHAREGIVITNEAGDIINVNAAFTAITGYSREEVLGKNPRLLNSGRQGAEFYQAMYIELQDKGYWNGEIWNRRKNGEVYAELLTITAVRDTQGQVQHFIAMFFDISDIKKQQELLEHIAHFDALTNLPNRVLLADRLQQAMLQALRRGRSLAVVYLDLDGFKLVNDTYGHDMGDIVIKGFADVLKRVKRDTDAVGRFGGEEFVIVCEETDERGAMLLAERIRSELEATQFHTELGPLKVTCSLGASYSIATM